MKPLLDKEINFRINLKDAEKICGKLSKFEEWSRKNTSLRINSWMNCVSKVAMEKKREEHCESKRKEQNKYLKKDKQNEFTFLDNYNIEVGIQDKERAADYVKIKEAHDSIIKNKYFKMGMSLPNDFIVPFDDIENQCGKLSNFGDWDSKNISNFEAWLYCTGKFAVKKRRDEYLGEKNAKSYDEESKNESLLYTHELDNRRKQHEKGVERVKNKYYTEGRERDYTQAVWFGKINYVSDQLKKILNPKQIDDRDIDRANNTYVNNKYQGKETKVKVQKYKFKFDPSPKSVEISKIVPYPDSKKELDETMEISKQIKVILNPVQESREEEEIMLVKKYKYEFNSVPTLGLKINFSKNIPDYISQV